MQTKEERLQEMENFLSDWLETIFIQRAKDAMRIFLENEDKIRLSFLDTIMEGVDYFKAKISSGHKRPICFLHFSYLFSDAHSNALRLKIDCYDEEYYADICGMDLFWEYGDLFPFIDDDMSLLRKELSKRFVRFMDYELLDIKMYYLVGVFILAKEILKALLKTNGLSDKLLDISGSELAILYGAYLDRAELLKIIKRGSDTNGIFFSQTKSGIY